MGFLVRVERRIGGGDAAGVGALKGALSSLCSGSYTRILTHFMVMTSPLSHVG